MGEGWIKLRVRRSVRRNTSFADGGQGELPAPHRICRLLCHIPQSKHANPPGTLSSPHDSAFCIQSGLKILSTYACAPQRRNFQHHQARACSLHLLCRPSGFQPHCRPQGTLYDCAECFLLSLVITRKHMGFLSMPTTCCCPMSCWLRPAWGR